VPARNWRREILSCSVQELMGAAKQRSTAATRAGPRKGTGIPLLHLLHKECGCCRMTC
jgi:hypothetical protein